MRLAASLSLALLLSACTPVNIHYNADKTHHRPTGFVNSDASIAVGGFPWYEIMFRSWRGDFRPAQPPAGGYAAFAREWSVPVDHARIAMRTQEPQITWLGHASLLLQVAGLNVLIDPQFSPTAGPDLGFVHLGAPRLVPAPLTPEALPPIDLVFISHNHYDHLDIATLTRLRDAGQAPRYIVPLGMKAWFEENGIANVSELDWWDELSVGTLTLHLVPVQHWSRRNAFDTNAVLWGGIVLEWQRSAAAPWRFMYTGDTGYSADFKEIRRRLGSMDFLALPLGAYLPRDFMQPQHIDPDDAVQIVLDLDAKQALGVHWGTYALSHEAFDQPPRDLASALRQRRLSADRVWLMKQGETRAVKLAP
ncbi:MAG: MBL fold metallo-hydrolase [Burkholderiaceae bacterium]|nr:MBL fold metallo-hydrolase [Sulfuritalea sp.]MCF8175503.1 MBL fold metallo-hydrolase [Burkholderiaceae bacterium]